MTDPGMPAARTSVVWPLIFGLLGLGALGGVVVFVLRADRTPAPMPFAALPAPAAPLASPPSAASPDPALGFDVVRVNPKGDAVLAGHAAPGAQVTVQDAGNAVGTATADNAGNWVIVPTTPLPAGAQALTLSERRTDGSTIAAPGSLLTLVPGPASPSAPPASAVAVLDQPGVAPRVLQAPLGNGNAKLGLGAVDYDDHGQLRFAGTAPPGSTVRVYVDNRAAGDAVADAQGRWTLSPEAAISPGQHRLRVDQIDPRGQVVTRVELPFQREQLTAAQIGPNRVVVQPGESLWRLARETYGKGVRYTVIFQANQEQIRDPWKIYPGQVFAVPPSEAAEPGR
jgi:Bacterial Ig-like domain/Bacterial Ig domain/LysM domain